MKFRGLMEAADGIIDAVHAEPCRLVPMRTGQYAGREPDPARQAVDFEAVLDWPAEPADIGLKAELTTRKPELHVLNSKLPRSAVRVGDRVEALERDQAFEVRAIHPEGMTRYRLELSHER